MTAQCGLLWARQLGFPVGYQPGLAERSFLQGHEHVHVCVCVCSLFVHVEARVQPCMSFSVSLPCVLRLGFLSFDSELTDSVRLPGQQVPGVYLSLLPQLRGYKCVSLCSIFDVGSEVSTQVLVLMWQALC